MKVFASNFEQSVLFLSLSQAFGEKANSKMDGRGVSVGIMTLVDILKLFVFGCS